MKHLRQYIRNMIIEGVRFEEDLMILNHPKNPTLYLLCDADWSIAMDGGSLNKDKFFRTNVLAMIQLSHFRHGPCNGASEVKLSAAIDGYGPTMYDCVMELTNGIINDRDSVSKAAQRVMRRYKDTRSDVEKSLLDNTEDSGTYPMTPDPSDDCIPGDSAMYGNGVNRKGRYEDDPFSYSYNKELSPTVTQWKQKGDEFIKQMESTADIFYTDLRVWGTELFNTAGL